MWPFDSKRIATLKEFYIEECPINEWGSVRIPEPIEVMDGRLLPHLRNITLYEDYQLAKSKVNDCLRHNQFVRRINWQLRNARGFHWCGGVLNDGAVVVFQLNYEHLREYGDDVYGH